MTKPLNKDTAPKSVRPERIIQFGKGKFMRAFIDWIVFHMNQKTDFNGSVVMVQARQHSDPVDAFQQQDYLFHVNLHGCVKGEKINTFECVDVINRCVNPYAEFDEYLALAEQPDMRFIISNTTEAGIVFDPECRFEDRPALSYPGKLVQLLYHRFETFHGDPNKGFIIFPCELIYRNGDVLNDCIRQYIDHWKLPKEFRNWFEDSCKICSTLVDRIVTGYPTHGIEDIEAEIGYHDQYLVQAENFHLWIIEAPREVANEFPANKAGLNVLFVPSEELYHKRKVALLNGPHTVLSPVAFLSGIDIVRDACQHPVVGQYIHKVQFDELMQTIDLPESELEQYANDVLERFQNPFIDHQLTSIMLNSFSKFNTRDLPGIRIFLERMGELPKGLVFGLAAIITYYKGGEREDHTPIKLSDDPKVIETLQEAWASNDVHIVAKTVLGAKHIWQEDLNKIPGLTQQVEQDLLLIQQYGMLEAVKTIL